VKAIAPDNPLIVESIPETGTVQNLGPAFTSLFDLNTQLPAINVMSGVPEPSTWAMMLLGFAGLGFVGYQSAGRRRAAWNL
jgi:hypothetical protein